MSTILYYSNYCDNCKKLLGIIGKSPVKDEMHFLCVDNRTQGSNGATYLVLSNGQQVLLPPSVTAVPALLLLNRGHKVLFGEEIMKHITPSIDQQKQRAVQQHGEPSAFVLGGFGSNFGVASDNYSYLDQSSEDLSAKGNGGMRQQHHYATINFEDKIETPPDNYQADTIGNGGVTMDQLRQQRAQDVQQNKNRR